MFGASIAGLADTCRALSSVSLVHPAFGGEVGESLKPCHPMTNP